MPLAPVYRHRAQQLYIDHNQDCLQVARMQLRVVLYQFICTVAGQTSPALANSTWLQGIQKFEKKNLPPIPWSKAALCASIGFMALQCWRSDSGGSTWSGGRRWQSCWRNRGGKKWRLQPYCSAAVWHRVVQVERCMSVCVHDIFCCLFCASYYFLHTWLLHHNASVM